jgi:hypothetical protein
MDFWNIIDCISVISFFGGFYVYHDPSCLPHLGCSQRTSYSDPAAWLGDYLNEALFANSETSPFEWSFHTGAICYGLSIFCMYLKLLWSLALFDRLDTIVRMFILMFIDVAHWIVVYALFLFAFSIGMAGAGNPDSILNKCHVKLGNALRSTLKCAPD